jgi:GntR family transcriptional regulator
MLILRQIHHPPREACAPRPMPFRALPQPADVLSAAVPSDNPVHRASRLPLYVQVKRELQRMIARHDVPGGRFHTDDELCERFKVSRITVRQAVAELVDEGILKRTPGRGTFIVRPTLEERAPVETAARPSFGGAPVEIEITAFAVLPCPRAVAVELGIPPGRRVRHVRRLRRHQGLPVRLDHRYLRLAVARSLTVDDAASQSLVEFLSAHAALARADMQMEARAAAPDEAAVLQVLVGEPVLVRHLVYRDTQGVPLMVGHSVYRSDLMRYAVSIPCGPAAARPR